MKRLPEVFNKYNPFIEAELKSLFKERDLYLYDMMQYHMGWKDSHGNAVDNNKGKMLRATLCLLACESLNGGDFKKALPIAAAIELIHNFSLIHDDIQDDDEFRRHRPTVWKIWGKPQAINAGSALKMLSTLSVLNLKEYKIPAEKQVEIFKILDDSCLAMIEGQFLDIDFEDRPDISVDDYLDMIEKKTSALIIGSLKIGAVLNIDTGKLDPFEKFGKFLGLAFQIKDDILGIWGNDKKTGKPNGNDIRKRKKSLPIIFCLQNSDGKIKERLSNAYKKKNISQRGVNNILNHLDRVKAREFCDEMAGKYYGLALKQAKELPVPPGKREEFEEIARFLIEREF